MRLFRSKISLAILLLVVIAGSWLFATHGRKVDFVTDVKPIINKHCISCHGGVKKQGGFSLLFREEALAKTESGKFGIVPGDPGNSEMIRRLTLKDPEERMPYRHDPLAKEEITILRNWVKQGAEWGEHWAYTPLQKTPAPALPDSMANWARNDIDLFIGQKLAEASLRPSAEADKATLLRRASLDIIGMPAPANLATKFLADNSENAYPELVDSLLASPHYGEKWSSFWLDIARYADTKGYERDSRRNIWQYRDWLIRAFNKDMPYNQFITEQIAGDLLPDPTDDQYIASAFHRNTMTNDEGGTNNEEFRTAAVMDRVNTTWQGLLGTTFACVQCHSHPYDPFRHEDYYKFMAFFNNSRDEDTEADYPLLRHFDDRLQQQLNELNVWIIRNGNPQQAAEITHFLKTWQPTYNSLQADSFTNSELSDTKWLSLRNNAVCRYKNVYLQGKTELLFRYQSGVQRGIWNIHLDHPDGPVIASIPIKPSKNGWNMSTASLQPSTGTHDLFFTYTNPQLKSADETGITFDWFYFTNAFPGADKPGYAAMKALYWQMLNAPAKTTPVMMDNPAFMHRPTYVFERGNWMVKGEEVSAGVPASLNAMPKGAPKNRLGLAMWLTDKQNPLTARTMVNHVWEQVFGVGLAETLEDLGSQGIPPTHRELLEWLSYEYMTTDGWSTKKLLRKIFLSATYRQSSKVTPDLLAKDPENRLYARFPRVRLTAEQLRDQALCISGLMSEKMYGPAVFPYQPDGIWLSPWNGDSWKQDNNEDQYRRAVYTFWKRSAAYPSMMAFDAVSREVCTARRIRTNTPLQALTTLNDSAFIDMAKHFAIRMQQQAPGNVQQQLAAGFKSCTGHVIDAKSLQSLTKLFTVAEKQFETDSSRAAKLLAVTPANASADLAALTVVANAMLNLDEVVTKN